MYLIIVLKFHWNEWDLSALLNQSLTEAGSQRLRLPIRPESKTIEVNGKILIYVSGIWIQFSLYTREHALSPQSCINVLSTPLKLAMHILCTQPSFRTLCVNNSGIFNGCAAYMSEVQFMKAHNSDTSFQWNTLATAPLRLISMVYLNSLLPTICF